MIGCTYVYSNTVTAYYILYVLESVSTLYFMVVLRSYCITSMGKNIRGYISIITTLYIYVYLSQERQ